MWNKIAAFILSSFLNLYLFPVEIPFKEIDYTEICNKNINFWFVVVLVLENYMP